MTELELQELTDKIIAKLKADSLTIDQLTQTNVLTGMDFLELNSGRKVSLDDLRKFIRGYGIYLEIISKLDNETIPTDNNVFSSLRVLFEISKALEELKKIYLRKDQDDETKYLLKLLGGMEVGEAVDSMVAGKGIVADRNGRMQLSRLEVRDSAVFKEVIYNRLNAQEGDKLPVVEQLRRKREGFGGGGENLGHNIPSFLIRNAEFGMPYPDKHAGKA